MKLDYQSNIEDYNFDKKIVKIFKEVEIEVIKNFRVE